MLPGPVLSADEAQILELSGQDVRQNQTQRELADQLARRHVGPSLRQTEDDLRILQRLIDGKFVDADEPFALQALGVALGDVMVSQLGLEWVILADDKGRSRALRVPDSENLFFPVTMLSRRIEGGVQPDTRKLYENVATETRRLEEERKRRRGRSRSPLTRP